MSTFSRNNATPLLVWCKKIIDVSGNATDPSFLSYKFYVLCAESVSEPTINPVH